MESLLHKKPNAEGTLFKRTFGGIPHSEKLEVALTKSGKPKVRVAPLKVDPLRGPLRHVTGITRIASRAAASVLAWCMENPCSPRGRFGTTSPSGAAAASSLVLHICAGVPTKVKL